MLSNQEIQERINILKEELPAEENEKASIIAALDLLGSTLEAIHCIAASFEQLEMNTRKSG